jgi:DNA-directed RNA polymerase specialized sigma24 family protein/sortase (surface protein transpeptidase)
MDPLGAGPPCDDTRARLPSRDRAAGAVDPWLTRPQSVLEGHDSASDDELLAALRAGDALALAEVYERTAPAVHAVARRLVPGHRVEALLHAVYADLWTSPPALGPLHAWLRAQCFHRGAAQLRSDRTAPASASISTLLEDLPTRTGGHVTEVEQILAALPEAQRRALCLAHDRGLRSTDQPDAGAPAALGAALSAVAGGADTAHACHEMNHAADWVLGLLPDDAAAVCASAEARACCGTYAKALRWGRRRLEGLPPSHRVGTRVLAYALSSGSGHDSARVLATMPTDPRAQDTPEGVEATPTSPDGVAAQGTVAPRRSTTAAALVAAALSILVVANGLTLTQRALASGDAQIAQALPVASEPVDMGSSVAERAARQTPAAASSTTPAARQPATSAEPRVVAPRRFKPIAAPVRLAIPKIAVDKRLVELGIQDDGTLASPVHYDDPGWYRDGVAPGERGPAVIVGHVDSLDGPAIFFQLSTLRRNDKVQVERADGTTATFVIDRVERFPKENFPTSQVYGDTARPELRLITCGGAFNNTTRHYDDNVVAFAHLQKPSRATASADDKRERGSQRKDERASKRNAKDEGSGRAGADGPRRRRSDRDDK